MYVFTCTCFTTLWYSVVMIASLIDTKCLPIHLEIIKGYS